MPWTLYRYILKQIIKLMVVATVVLLVIISFGAAIKPLSDGVIAPGGLIKFIIYTMPTMLEFTLPFAGAFAGVIVFCRLAADNEIIACSACGLSYRRVLLPVFVLGLALTMGLFYLSNWVVPRFYHLVAQMLERDITRLMVAQVRKGQTVDQLENAYLYADAADDSQPPPLAAEGQIQASKLIRLSGVALTKTDKNGKPETESTAASATVLLYNYEGANWATLKLEDVSIYDLDRQQLFYVREWEVPPIALPSPLKDNPRFLSWPQLNALVSNPDRYDQIRTRKEKLVGAMVRQKMLIDARAALANGGSLELTGPLGERYNVTAPVIDATKKNLTLLALGESDVKIYQLKDTLVKRKIEARKAVLTLDSEEPAEEPRINVEVTDARVSDTLASGRGTEHAALPIIRARWPVPVVKPLLQQPLEEVIDEAINKGPEPTKEIASAVNGLRQEQIRLARRVLAQVHERAASSVGCMLILLLGAMLSLKFRGGTPLVVYFWTFLLAATVVIINRSGLNFAREPSVHLATGLLVLWSGNLAIAALLAVTYHRITRN
jgi:lipopolysaccharide export LptBFGC system permease protein LptF